MAARWNTLCAQTKNVPHYRIWPDDIRNCTLCGELNPYLRTPQTPARAPSASRTVVVIDDSPSRVGALSNGTNNIFSSSGNNFPSLQSQEARIHRNDSIASTRREDALGRQHAGSVAHSRRQEASGIISERYQLEVQVIIARYERLNGRIVWLSSECEARTKERISLVNQRVNRTSTGDQIPSFLELLMEEIDENQIVKEAANPYLASAWAPATGPTKASQKQLRQIRDIKQCLEMFDSTGKGCWKIFIIIEEEISDDDNFVTPKPKAKKVAKVKTEELSPLHDTELKIKKEPLRDIHRKRSRTQLSDDSIISLLPPSPTRPQRSPTRLKIIGPKKPPQELSMPLDDKDEEDKDQEDIVEVDKSRDAMNEGEDNNMAVQEAGETIVVTKTGVKRAKDKKK